MSLTKKQWQRWKKENPDVATDRAAKIAAAHKGKNLSDEHRNAISRAMSGRKISQEHRAAISEAMRGRKYSKLNQRLAVTAVFLSLALVTMFYIESIAFVTTGFEWTKWWENRQEVVLSSSTEWTSEHVVFGEHRTANCSDNMVVMTGDQNINFSIEGEMIVDGICSEADVKFRNIYYTPYEFDTFFVPPTPANDSVVNNSWAVVNLTSTTDITLALLEVSGANSTTMNVMSGMWREWFYNITDLQEGDYSFRAYLNDSYDNVNATDMFVFHVNYSSPAGEPVAEQPVYLTEPIQSSTYYIYYGRLPSKIRNVEFVPPTPEDNSIVTDNFIFVNATTDADATMAVLELIGQNETTMTEMAGFERNWWYNITDIPDGVYTFHIFANDTEGYAGASPSRTVTVTLANITEIITENVTENVTENITENVTENITENITQTIEFVLPTLDNGSITNLTWTFINVSLGLNTTDVQLEWNGTNESMGGAETLWWLNKTNLTEGVYTYRVIADNTSSDTRTLTVNYSWVSPFEEIIAPIAAEGFSYGSEKHRNHVYFEQGTGKGQGIEFEVENSSVTWQLKNIRWSDSDGKEKKVVVMKISNASDADETGGTAESTGTKIKENKIKYSGISKVIDLEYVYYTDLLKEYIVIGNNSVLQTPKGLKDNITLDITFKLKWSEGLSVEVAGNVWNESDVVTENVLFRKDGKFMFIFLQPYATDAVGSTVNATYKLTKKGKKNLISIQVPYEWLANATYPITIDPTMSSSEWSVTEVVALGSGRSDSSGGNLNLTMVPGEPAIGQSAATGLFTACLGFFCTGYDITSPIVGTPTFNVSSPTNKNTGIQVNATWSDNVAVDACNYSVSGATTIAATAMTLYNSTSDYMQGTASAVVTALNDGANTFTVVCRDTSNNTGTNNAVLTVDTLIPTVTFQLPTPTNATTIGRKFVYVNTTVDGTGTSVSVCQLNWNGTNESMTMSGSGTNVVCYNNKTGLTDSLYVYKVFASDSASNEGVSQTRTVTVNTKPVVSNEVFDDSTANPANQIDLIGNSTRTVWCNATVNDPEGASNLNVSWARAYSYQGGSGTCTGNYTNCYYNSSCEWITIPGNTTAKTASCTFQFQYNAVNSSTDFNGWICNMSANDTDSYIGSTASAGVKKVNALLAIHVDDSIDFGTVNAGTNETYVAHNNTAYNYGNVKIDLQLNGTQLTCPAGYGNISAGFLHYSYTTFNATYASSTALNATPTTCDFNLPKTMNATGTMVATSNKTYWGIGVPGGSGGLCTGTVHFTAVAG